MCYLLWDKKNRVTFLPAIIKIDSKTRIICVVEWTSPVTKQLFDFRIVVTMFHTNCINVLRDIEWWIFSIVHLFLVCIVDTYWLWYCQLCCSPDQIWRWEFLLHCFCHWKICRELQPAPTHHGVHMWWWSLWWIFISNKISVSVRYCFLGSQDNGCTGSE